MACVNILLSRCKISSSAHSSSSAVSKASSLDNVRQQLCSEARRGPVTARRNSSEMHYLRWENIQPPKRKACVTEDISALDSQGPDVHHLSSPGLVCGHVFEAYQWLPEHPVTLQSRPGPVEGHSHVARGSRRGMDRGGGEAGHCLSALEGELFSARSNVRRVVGGTGGAFNMIWRDERGRDGRRCRREQGE